MKAKLATMLGFAQKSGNLISGSALVLARIDRRKVLLVLLGQDVSESSKNKVKSKCLRLNIPIFEVMTIDEMSKAIGKCNRTVIGITDKKFSENISHLISDMGI